MAQEFLRLSAEEAAYVELVRLATGVRTWRQRRKLARRTSRSGSGRANRASPRWRPETRRCRWICSSDRCWPLAPLPM